MTIRDQIIAEKTTLEWLVTRATNRFTKRTGIKVDRVMVDQCIYAHDANGKPIVEANIVTAFLEL